MVIDMDKVRLAKYWYVDQRLSLQKAAKKIGVHYKTISNWRNANWYESPAVDLQYPEQIPLDIGKSPYWIRDFLLFYEDYAKSDLYKKPWYSKDLLAKYPQLSESQSLDMVMNWMLARETEQMSSGHIVSWLYIETVIPDAPQELREWLAGLWTMEMVRLAGTGWNVDSKEGSPLVELVIRTTPWRSARHNLAWHSSLNIRYGSQNPSLNKGSKKLITQYEYIEKILNNSEYLLDMAVDMKRAEIELAMSAQLGQAIDPNDPIGNELLAGDAEKEVTNG